MGLKQLTFWEGPWQQNKRRRRWLPRTSWSPWGRCVFALGSARELLGQRGRSQRDEAAAGAASELLSLCQAGAGLEGTPCVKVSWALDDSRVWWLSDLHAKVNAGPFLLSAQTLPTFLTGSSPVSGSQAIASINRQREWWGKGKGARYSGVRCQQLPRWLPAL